MKIGIFGGSFDPVHDGHIVLAKSAASECGLDRVYFVPAKRSPFKSDNPLISARHRIRMIRFAIGEYPKFKISRIEMDRAGPSYSYRTVRFFKKRFRLSALYFILGDDNLKDFEKWKNYREIAGNCVLVAGRRSGHKNFFKPGPFRVFRLKSRMTEISSSSIRRSIEEGKKQIAYCPSSVLNYILRNNLYQKCERR